MSLDSEESCNGSIVKNRLVLLRACSEMSLGSPGFCEVPLLLPLPQLFVGAELAP